MSKREEKTILIRNFLRMIIRKKVQLFDQYSPNITKESRRKAWNDVRDYSVSIGLVTNNRDTAYIRDVAWQNLRGRTMSKLDKQTGGAGGADKKLDETDLLIIEILGKDSPVIKGLALPDSMGFGRNEESDASPSDSRDPIDENVDDPLTYINQKCQSFDKLESTHSLPVAATSVKGPGKRVLVQMSDITKQQELLKKLKLELEVRKLQIDVWNRENELGITHTILTEQIERKVEEVVSNTSNEMIGQPLVILDNSNCVVNDDGKIILLQNMSMDSSA